jgi:FkbM family methyltransferase
MDCQVVVTVPGASRMMVTTSDLVGRMLATSGVWEPHVTAAFRALLAEGDVCVDAGAHVGYFTLIAARLVGPSGRVYALEPDEETYSSLLANVKLNSATNVVAQCVGAGSADRVEPFFAPPLGNTGSAAFRSRWGDVRPDRPTPRQVPVRAISSVLRDDDLPRLRLVKIDVEGYELEALRGVAAVFESGHRPALIVEIHGKVGRDSGPWLADLRRRFSLFSYTLRAERGADRTVPPSMPLVPMGDASLRGLDDEFVEVLLSPVDLEASRTPA